MKYNFIDAQEMAKKYPGSFIAPNQKELDFIKPESFIKVCHNKERFWVKVISVLKERIEGVIDNDLVNDQPFRFGDKVEIKKDCVYNTME